MNRRIERLLGRFYREAAAEGGDVGAAAGAADAGAADAANPDPSLLAQGADAAAQAAAAAAGKPGAVKPPEDPLAWLPERFRVKGEDGALKVEDSAKNVAKAYSELERRMKDTGLPPESPDKYEFKPPKGLEKLELDAAMSADAKKGLHALGLTQKQFQGVMEMYVQSLNGIVERGTTMGSQKAAEELAKSWGQPDTPAFRANLGLAHKAFAAFADEADKALIDQIGNSPVMLRVLAKVGRELQEDTAVEGQIMAGESLEALMKDPAYFNAAHARHAEVKAKVMAHFEAQAAVAARKAAA